MVENPQFGGFAARIVRAFGRRAADDIEALADLAALHRAVSAEVVTSVHRLHDEWGYSCAEIAARLGVTKQAVHERFFVRAVVRHSDERCREMEPLFPLETDVAAARDGLDVATEKRASVAC
ncbi:MAG: hypothetical protein ACJ74O_13650 [Frankiaceae bacterium]